MGYEVKYPWLARFSDGSELRQFENGQEILFRKVLDRQAELISFSVGPVTVNLVDGSFTLRWGGRLRFSCGISGQEEQALDASVPKRIIYFRRVTRVFNADTLKQNEIQIVYAVGWQATLNARNVKHIAYIHPGGDLVLE